MSSVRDLKPSVLLYCELNYGAGHLMRTRAIARGLAERFLPVLIVRGEGADKLPPEPGVEMIVQSPFSRTGADELWQVHERFRPSALLLEYYPFGRPFSSLFLVPFLRRVRAANSSILVLTSLRDILDCDRSDQSVYDRRVALLANSHFDGILVHSDPRFVRLDDSFARIGELKVPIFYTGYAVPPSPLPSPRSRKPVILVSAGGGRGSKDRLLALLHAQQSTSLGRDFQMKVLAGMLLEEESWRSLQEVASAIPSVELVRWVPDLREELASAALSVSSCGYNTALDILRTVTPALIFPALEMGDEQRRRATIFESLGAWTLMQQGTESPEHLQREIRLAATRSPKPLGLDCDGAARTASILADLLARRTPTALAAHASHA